MGVQICSDYFGKNITFTLAHLCWFRCKARYKIQDCAPHLQRPSRSSPQYLSDLFHLHIPSQNPRSFDTGQMFIPLHRLCIMLLHPGCNNSSSQHPEHLNHQTFIISCFKISNFFKFYLINN